MNLGNLSDEALFGQVEALSRTERFTLVDLLIHLGELDMRTACQRKGYASVFAYLTCHLGYSESDAMRRVRTARAARKYPSVLRLIANGELHLVGVSMLQPLLTSANHEILLRKAARRSTRQIERMVAELSPAAAEPRDRIRALPASVVPAPPAPSSDSNPATQSQAVLTSSAQEPVWITELEPVPAPPSQAPPRRVLFTFTAAEEVHGWFEAARDLLRHRFPSGAMEEIIGEALKTLVERERVGHAHQRKGASKPSESRHIPKHIEDEVWRRDGGRCAYLGAEGTRCGETAWLELDHIVPWALGGRSDDPANIRMLCRAHNQSEALRIFGASGGRP